MRNLGRVSSWNGRARSLSLMLALVIAGCAHLPGIRPDAREHLEFLAQAMNASLAVREAMWQNARLDQGGAAADLRKALMQSVPDHSGYDPVAAEHGLQALLAQAPSPDVTAVAQVRLAELKAADKATEACRAETAALKDRLSKVVDIERKLNDDGH